MNDVSGRRLDLWTNDQTPTSSASVLGGFPTEQRLLEDAGSEVKSNCFCPLGAQINEEGPSVEALQESFSASAKEDNINLESQGFFEVSAVDCDPDQKSFETTVDLNLLAKARGMNRGKIEDIVELFVDTYNAMATNSYCDPEFRRLESVVDYSFNVDKRKGNDILNNDDCKLVTLELTVQGTCRNCLDNTPLFASESDVTSDDVSIQGEDDSRRLLSSLDVELSRELRRLSAVSDERLLQASNETESTFFCLLQARS